MSPVGYGPWLVSDEEIRQALGRYQASSPSLRAELEADDLWRSWVEWLQETADHGAGSGWARILD
jgi:hypothetical protein